MNIRYGLTVIILGCILTALMTRVAYAIDDSKASNKNRGIYIEALAGYNRYALVDIGNPQNTWSNGRGNFAFAGALGYQCCRYFSLEIGGIYTLNASAKNPLSIDPLTKETIKLRHAYLLGKLLIMTYDRTHVFAKLGLGYQRLKVLNGPFGTERLSNWGAVFGAGTSYYFTRAVYMSLQWLRFTGKVRDGVGYTTSPNIFLLGFGYKF